MAVRFIIPGPLRELAGNQDEVRVKDSPETVADALTILWAHCPGVRDRVVTELGEVRQNVNVFVDGESIRYTGGLAASVGDGAEIVILPAVSGG
jgi:molybdopterin converting factor small subunit